LQEKGKAKTFFYFMRKDLASPRNKKLKEQVGSEDKFGSEDKSLALLMRIRLHQLTKTQKSGAEINKVKRQDFPGRMMTK
jgi:hypothetical protein